MTLSSYLCQNIYPDEVCRDNYTLHYYDPPLLYDLHSDPSEIYNLSVADYGDVMSQINKVGATVCYSNCYSRQMLIIS